MKGWDDNYSGNQQMMIKYTGNIQMMERALMTMIMLKIILRYV